MQLKGRRSIHKALAAATCTLLSPATHGGSVGDEQLWDTDLSSLFYLERERITVNENVASAKAEIGDEQFLSVRIVTDTMTGASPNGAVASSNAQTFTAPSGGTFGIPAGKVPLADFRDIRAGINAEWERPHTDSTIVNYGASVSVEKDYTSMGLSAISRHDINRNLTTITAGMALDFDIIEPIGGVPVGLRDTTLTERGSNEQKTTLKLLGGITQVINRRTITQLNYTLMPSHGYQTDPYKLVSIIDGSVDAAGNPGVAGYINELRPDDRLMQSLYLKTMHQFRENVATFDYRYYWDDWDVTSHTLDFRYRFELHDNYYIQPPIRLYSQTAADLYRPSLLQAIPVPQYISADYRLGNLDSATAGLTFGGKLHNEVDFSVRAEYLRQEDREGEFLSLNAVILQGTISLWF